MTGDSMSFEVFCGQHDTDMKCTEALYALRWPAGFRCPSCDCRLFSHIRTRRLPLYQCSSCRRQTSIISGTIMEGSRTPLPIWFQAMYLLSQPDGISALRLSDLISVTYKTAWHLAHKIRFALQSAEASHSFVNNFRLDAFFYGTPLYPDARQPLLIGTSIDEEDRPTRVVLHQPHPEHVDADTRRVLPSGYQAFRQQYAQPSAIPDSDRSGKLHPAAFPIARAVTSWLNYTFNGIGAKHLQAYVDEFAFRVNGMLQDAPILNMTLHWCSVTRALQYNELTRSKPVLSVPWLYFGSKSRWKGYHFSRWGA